MSKTRSQSRDRDRARNQGRRPRPGRLGVGIVSAGRVGAVLGSALRAVDHRVVGVHAVSEASRERRGEAASPDRPRRTRTRKRTRGGKPIPPPED